MFYNSNGNIFKKKNIEKFFETEQKNINEFEGIKINLDNYEIILDNKNINQYDLQNSWPNDWNDLISKEDSDVSILQINEKINNININVIIHFDNDYNLVAYRSICPHMGANDLWSFYKDSNTHICNNHGMEFGKNDLDKFDVKKINNHKWIIKFNIEKFTNVNCNNCSLDHLKDIEDL